MSLTVVYGIRHKPTGNFMPVPRGYAGRGSSFWEPTEQEAGLDVRLFNRKRSADMALTQWLRGEHHPDFDSEYDEWSGNYSKVCVGAVVKPKPDRIRADMEVVTINLVPEW